MSDLATKLFALEIQQFHPVEIAFAQREICRLVALARQRTRRCSEIQMFAAALSQVVFREGRLQFGRKSTVTDFTITRTLSSRRGNCLGLASVYSAIADAVDAPVMPLLFQGHLAMCVLERGRLYPIELCRGGRLSRNNDTESDILYRSRGRGQVLSDDQLIAVQLSNRAAFVHAARNEYHAAACLLRRSAELFPTYMGSRINLAALLMKMGDLKGAESVLIRPLDTMDDGPFARRMCQLQRRITHMLGELSPT